MGPPLAAGQYDEPFDQLSPRCVSQRGEQPAVVDRELVSILDYSYTGQVETVHAEGVAGDKALALSIAQPGEQIFRVIERSGRVCCRASGATLELALTNQRMVRLGYAHHLLVSWQVED